MTEEEKKLKRAKRFGLDLAKGKEAKEKPKRSQEALSMLDASLSQVGEKMKPKGRGRGRGRGGPQQMQTNYGRGRAQMPPGWENIPQIPFPPNPYMYYGANPYAMVNPYPPPPFYPPNLPQKHKKWVRKDASVEKTETSELAPIMEASTDKSEK